MDLTLSSGNILVYQGLDICLLVEVELAKKKIMLYRQTCCTNVSIDYKHENMDWPGLDCTTFATPMLQSTSFLAQKLFK